MSEEEREGLKLELGPLANMAKELESYLRGRAGLEVTSAEAGKLVVRAAAPGLKELVRTYLKRFLNDKGLKGEFRVRAQGDTLRLAERRARP